MRANITTSRLLLRPPVMADAPAIARLVGDFEVSKWLSVVPHPYTLADARAFLRSGVGPWQRAITLEGALIGLVGIGPGLGFWLGRPYWGQGYMSEAAAALVGAWFDAVATDRLRTEGSARPREGVKRPPGGAVGRCPGLPPGGTVAEGMSIPENLTSGYVLGNAASAAIHAKLGFERREVVAQFCRAQGREMPLQRMVLRRAAWEARHG